MQFALWEIHAALTFGQPVLDTLTLLLCTWAGRYRHIGSLPRETPPWARFGLLIGQSLTSLQGFRATLTAWSRTLLGQLAASRRNHGQFLRVTIGTNIVVSIL